MINRVSGNSFAEVSLNRIRHNLGVLKEFLPPDVKQMAVVKADGYGHGAVQVAKAVENRVAWFAVNDIAEGMELRKAGIENPILVFGVPDMETSPVYENYNLTATVSSVSHFDLLPAGTEYHLNFDTGMGRLGFRPEEYEKVREAMNAHASLICTGIYSHFATSDNPGSPKVLEQLDLFKSIRSRLDQPLLTHMGNTGGTAFYPAAHFDMVRNGIGIYGYPPGATPIENLQPALRWKSRIVHIKTIEKGETVSYGARWKCPGRGGIAVIPAGYEEGIPRILTGKLHVAVKGSLYPVVGTVTMNYVMVYIEEDNYDVGDEVDLLGGPGLNAQEWAEKAGTIPYEILTGISDRVERRYV